MASLDNYFDIWNIVVNELIGDIWLTTIIGLIAIFILSVRFNMRFELSVFFSLFWVMIIYAATGLEILWIFAVLACGGLFFYNMVKGFSTVR